MNPRKPTSYREDGRRKHHHWMATIYYRDGETFGRKNTDRDKATNFAKRQKKSPTVKRTRVSQVS